MKKKTIKAIVGILMILATLLSGPATEYTKHLLDGPKKEMSETSKADHKKVTYSIAITREIEE
jgi:hypothetical protein